MELTDEIFETIGAAINDNIEEIFIELNIDSSDMRVDDNEIRCKCPVHDGGDNPSAFSYLKKYRSWKCFTRHCEEGNKGNINLVKLLLSKHLDKEFSFKDTVNWVAKFLNIEIGENSQSISTEQSEFNKILKNLKNRRKKAEDREVKVKIPIKYLKPVPVSEFFLNKGFSQDILKKYNVGYCNDPQKPMYLRSFAPVLDENAENILGASGRTSFEDCPYCPLFHPQGRGCPKDNPIVKGHVKWKHHGFKTSEVLYNQWFAKESIKNYGAAIITEGPKEVWWFEQQNIHNSLCLFGLNLFPYHIKRLLNMGSNKLILALDNDDRGQEAMDKIEQECGKYFKIYRLDKILGKNPKDLDEYSIEEFNSLIKPYLNTIWKNN